MCTQVHLEPKRPRISTYLGESFQLICWIFSEVFWLSEYRILARLTKKWPRRWDCFQATRCTQKGHGKEAQSLRQNCSSAISESRAAGPFRRRDLRFSTALVRSSPSAVGEPLGVTRTTLQREKQPICDLAARQKRRSPLAGRWPAAPERDRNRSYRILLGLDQLRVGLQGLFLDFNCS